MAGPGLLFSDTGDTSPTGIGTCKVCSCLALFSGCDSSVGTSTGLGRGRGEVLVQVTENQKEHNVTTCHFNMNY